jgi:hypothetical protein
MEDFKGTKGKWHAVEYAGTYIIQDGDMYEDNNILDSDIYTEEVVKANAQLIAAAPELLQSLSRLTDICSKDRITDNDSFFEEFDEAVDEANRVIDKALGKEK